MLGKNQQKAVMKPQKMWALVNKKGRIFVAYYGDKADARTVAETLSDEPWDAFKAKGWKIIRVNVTPVAERRKRK